MNTYISDDVKSKLKTYMSRHIVISILVLLLEVKMRYDSMLTGAEFVTLFQMTVLFVLGGHATSKWVDNARSK